MADASAAFGFTCRGELRHVDTSYLWQQESIKKKISMNKVPGTENPADMNTRGLNGELIDKFTRMLSMEHREGRAELAPEVCNLLHKLHCTRDNSRKPLNQKTA